MFLGKALYSHSASLHQGLSMGTSELLGKPKKLRGSDLRWTSIPSRGSRNTLSRFMLQNPGQAPAAKRVVQYTHIESSRLRHESTRLTGSLVARDLA